MGFLLQRTPIGFSARLSFPPAQGYSAFALILLALRNTGNMQMVRVASYSPYGLAVMRL
jgi:hypothetical protein